ncbi:hypothetical protein LAUMK13_05037 [Mycobacterium innocens]|uniref:Uncharacterized protein n=1 Tax=Mycobacterium innocens TaxID=2341083 RepID=A0A498QDW0_9MYCO|nr:hypothetical protein LAUMK13_05037 [Mycobacterium innocens]
MATHRYLLDADAVDLHHLGAHIVLEGHAHLKQWMMRRRAGRVELLDQPLKRHILVAVGIQRLSTHLLEHIAEPVRRSDANPQHPRVDEKPDQLIERLVQAPGDRRADHNVLTRTSPVQQHRPHRLQHHRGSRIVGHRQLLDPRPHLWVDAHLHRVTAVTCHRGPGPVSGQRHHLRQVGQFLLPVLQLPGDHAAWIGVLPQHLPLPQRVIHILHRQRRPLGLMTLAARPIRLAHITDQRPQRPPIAGDVVQHHRHHMLLGVKRIDLRADRDLRRQVEPIPRQRLQLPRQILLPQRDHRRRAAPPHPRVDRQHLLERHAIGLWVHGAQDFVAGDNIIDGRAQRIDVKRPCHPESGRHVVGRGAAFELVEEPQPLLGVRQRDRLGARHRRHRGPGAAGTLAVQRVGKITDGAGVEQRPHRHFHVQRQLQPRARPGGEQRIPTHREEIVIEPNPLSTEHVGEHAGDDFFGSGLRRSEHGGGKHRCRQRLSVELARGGQRELVKHHHLSRH